MSKLRITQIKSLIGSKPKHRLTMQALGFRRMNQTLVKNDTPQIRGMIHHVRHLVRIDEGAE
jgi:large subunit ribosomal protein L30